MNINPYIKSINQRFMLGQLDDILHYQKNIVGLTETERLVKEIDKVEFMKE